MDTWPGWYLILPTLPKVLNRKTTKKANCYSCAQGRKEIITVSESLAR